MFQGYDSREVIEDGRRGERNGRVGAGEEPGREGDSTYSSDPSRESVPPPGEETAITVGQEEEDDDDDVFTDDKTGEKEKMGHMEKFCLQWVIKVFNSVTHCSRISPISPYEPLLCLQRYVRNWADNRSAVVATEVDLVIVALQCKKGIPCWR